MNVGVLGVSHHTAPLEVRERFALDARGATRVIVRVLEAGLAREAVVLSTCNRTELYWAVQAEAEAGATAEAQITGLIDVLVSEAGLAPDEAADQFYLHRGADAARHLFRVASSLDSLVVGEAQIQGQVRAAYEQAASIALEPRAVGPLLARMFEMALAAGGRVRSETSLGRGAGSVPSAAVELARKVFGSLTGRRALVVGAGEMSELAGLCLRDEGVAAITVASRGEQRALALAERLGGRLVALDRLGDELARVDIVAAATSSPGTVLNRALFERAVAAGRRRPLFVMDMGVPRDVEPAVGGIDNVFLYDIDDLRQIVDANLRRRRSELPAAERIVSGAVAEFAAWHAGLDVVPTIRALRGRAEAIRQAELEKALRRIDGLDDTARAEIERLTKQLLNKMLHAPTAGLRAAASNGRGAAMLEAARVLFGLGEAGVEAEEEAEAGVDAEEEAGRGTSTGRGTGTSTGRGTGTSTGRGTDTSTGTGTHMGTGVVKGEGD